MSNDVFPMLPGLKWGTNKQPIWATKVLTAASGRETRGSFQSYPRWKFTLSYEFLRAGGGFSELQQLVGFFNQRMGSFDSFLYRDPNDYQVTDQALGTGDGSRVEYRLVRTLGGFVEPVLAPADVWVYVDRGNAGKWRVGGESRVMRYGRTDDITSAYWANLGVALTANVANDPDGVLAADRMREDTGNTVHRFSKTTTPAEGELHCFSWRVKPDGRTACSIASTGLAGGARTDFDLTGDGSALTVAGSPLAVGIRPLAGGWYRVWQVIRSTGPTAGTVSFNIIPNVNSSLTYTGDGASGLLSGGVQNEVLPEGAPLEPTAYVANTSGATLTVPADFTLGDMGYLTFTDAPAAGHEVSWSGTFYFRCRFTHDALDLEEFLQDLYSGKKVEFISEK